MTSKEFAVFISALKTYYPKENIVPTKEAMALWYDLLKDLPSEAVNEGLKRYVCLNRFPPSIADIRSFTASADGADSTMTAWNKVVVALNATSSIKAVYNDLPELIKRAIGGYEVYKDWQSGAVGRNTAMLCFTQSYQTELKNAASRSTLPEPLRRLDGKNLLIEDGIRDGTL